MKNTIINNFGILLISLAGSSFCGSFCIDNGANTVLSFGDNASIWCANGRPQTNSTPPGMPTGFSIDSSDNNLLWTSNDSVVIKGEAGLSGDNGFLFVNDSTGAVVKLTKNGDLVSIEPGLVKVDLYDDDYVATTDVVANITNDYYGFGEGRIEFDASGFQKKRFYLKDHLGSTRAIESEGGTQVEQVNYDAYGAKTLNTLTGNENPAKEKFTGKEYDSAGVVNVGDLGLGLTYFGARYYDPEVGIWTSCDPKRQFWSPYAYTGNGASPICGIDPNGQNLIVPIVAGLVGGIIAIGAELLTEAILGEQMDAIKQASMLAAAFTGGFITGATMGVGGLLAEGAELGVAGTILTGMAFGAIGSGIGNGAEQFSYGLFIGQSPSEAFATINYQKVGMSIALGGVSGGIGSVLEYGTRGIAPSVSSFGEAYSAMVSYSVLKTSGFMVDFGGDFFRNVIPYSRLATVGSLQSSFISTPGFSGLNNYYGLGLTYNVPFYLNTMNNAFQAQKNAYQEAANAYQAQMNAYQEQINKMIADIMSQLWNQTTNASR